MSKHAVLSASSAERWITCPASVQLAATVPRGPDSVYADEGTKAHELAYLHASVAFGHITSRTFTGRYNKWLKTHDYDLEEMTPHVMAYVRFLQDRVAAYPNSSILLEQRLPSGIDSCWGTSDAVIVSPTHVEIVDLKYGSGVTVIPDENSQLKIYALGALDEYGDMLGETEEVNLSIFQPRTETGSSTWSTSPAELRAWREVVRPIAKQALAGTGEFHPSEKACRWCPAAGICRARMKEATEADFGVEPDALSPQEIGELLGRLKGIRDWCNAVDQAAMDYAYTQKTPVPGWKVVLSGGVRQITDSDGAVAKLKELGYSTDQLINAKIKGIGELEKLLGKVEFAELLADYLGRTDGKPAMVREADPRPSISPDGQAAMEFEDVL